MPTLDAQPDEAGSKPITGDEAPNAHRAFSRLKREPSDDELNVRSGRSCRMCHADATVIRLLRTGKPAALGRIALQPIPTG